VIAACVADIPVTVPRLAPEDGALFLSHWLGAQEALRGGAQQNLNALAAKVGADRLAVRLLDSGDPRREMLALVALGHLQVQGAWPLAEKLAAGAPPVISLAAAQAMLRIDCRRALARVLALAAARDDWPLGRVATMLRECDVNDAGPALALALDAEWHQAPDGAGLARLLHLLGAAAAVAARATVRDVLAHSSRPEVIAAALGTLWNPEDGDQARACLRHAEWYVRLAAVKALGRIGGAADVDLLSGMLSDPSWWVRYRAAKALARLPGMNAETLERMRASVDDRYAKDMLGQVLSALEPR
jgi:HEAT repeat protein